MLFRSVSKITIDTNLKIGGILETSSTPDIDQAFVTERARTTALESATQLLSSTSTLLSISNNVSCLANLALPSISSVQTAIQGVQDDTKYQSTVSNLTTFTNNCRINGTLRLGNIIDVNSDISSNTTKVAVLEGKTLALETKTQYISVISNKINLSANVIGTNMKVSGSYNSSVTLTGAGDVVLGPGMGTSTGAVYTPLPPYVTSHTSSPWVELVSSTTLSGRIVINTGNTTMAGAVICIITGVPSGCTCILSPANAYTARSPVKKRPYCVTIASGVAIYSNVTALTILQLYEWNYHIVSSNNLIQ